MGAEKGRAFGKQWNINLASMPSLIMFILLCLFVVVFFSLVFVCVFVSIFVVCGFLVFFFFDIFSFFVVVVVVFVLGRMPL